MADSPEIKKKAEQIKHLSVSPLDVDKFIKVNELQPISNPMFFAKTNTPTIDGLLSNEKYRS